MDYFKKEIQKSADNLNRKQAKYLDRFASNLNEGINYYYDVFEKVQAGFEDKKTLILNELKQGKQTLQKMIDEIEILKSK